MTDDQTANEKKGAIEYFSSVAALVPYAKFLQGELTIGELLEFTEASSQACTLYNDYGVGSAQSAIEQVKAGRRAARAEADASVALEGFTCSPAAKAIFDRFANCEISSTQVLIELKALPEAQ
jgi:hypothetical protein